MSSREAKYPVVDFDSAMDKLWYGKHATGEKKSTAEKFQRVSSTLASLQHQGRIPIAESRLKFQSLQERVYKSPKEQEQELQNEQKQVPQFDLQAVSSEVQQDDNQDQAVHKMMTEVFDNIAVTQQIPESPQPLKKSKSDKTGFREKIAISLKRAFSVSSKVQSKPFDTSNINALKDQQNNHNQEVASHEASFYTLDESNADYMSTMSCSQVGGSPQNHSPAKSQNEVDNIFAQKAIYEEENNTYNNAEQNLVGSSLSQEQLLQFQNSKSSDIENKNNLNQLGVNVQNRDEANLGEETPINFENFHGRTEEIDAELDDIVIEEIKAKREIKKDDSDKVYCCSCLRQPN